MWYEVCWCSDYSIFTLTLTAMWYLTLLNCLGPMGTHRAHSVPLFSLYDVLFFIFSCCSQNVGDALLPAQHCCKLDPCLRCGWEVALIHRFKNWRDSHFLSLDECLATNHISLSLLLFFSLLNIYRTHSGGY